MRDVVEYMLGMQIRNITNPSLTVAKRRQRHGLRFGGFSLTVHFSHPNITTPATAPLPFVCGARVGRQT